MILGDSVLKGSSAYRTKRGTDLNKSVLAGFAEIMFKKPCNLGPLFEIVPTHQAPWGVYDVDEALDNLCHWVPITYRL